MAYGSEPDHLEASEADVALGDLQSAVVGEDKFCSRLVETLELAEERSFKPCFTMMTADKDDPRFDEFYLKGNELRYFMGLFLPLPSYYVYGLEIRDPHPAPAPNEHYSKLYVFQEKSGPKKTTGPYIPGKNAALFLNLQRIRLFAEEWKLPDSAKKYRWIRPYAMMLEDRILAWEIETSDITFLCIANMNMVFHQLWPEEIMEYVKGKLNMKAVATLSSFTDNTDYDGAFFEEHGIFIRAIQHGEGIIFGWLNA